MKRIVLFAYKLTSKSAKKLFNELQEENIPTLLVDRETYTPKKDDVVIGWGSGYWPSWKGKAMKCVDKWLNMSDVISDSVDKPQSFKLFRAAKVACPETTAQESVARSWLRNGHTVLARQETDGKDGSGIVLMHSEKDFVEAPLYSKYADKTWEYRVHVFNGKAFWSQERHPIEEENNALYRKNPEEHIRTSNNGWTLYVANAKIPAICKREAEKAIEAVGLDFGAVDIGWKEASKNSPESVCVYEVNTAPELSDRTCSAYVKILKNIAEEN